MQAIKHRPLLAIQLVAVAVHRPVHDAVSGVCSRSLMFVLLLRRFPDDKTAPRREYTALAVDLA